ncbi:GIY-YIG nuclease family protein [Dysgonomonas sp. Marseille-P4361]|uniref:GIY-YIG nuclease family protein n=1 Tax=Dysgonomonas sp. Marseille-P4361 TaxID=2161820 RepID=UPI000D55A026|nr:GIY-YIG nuclease family protein [Dysgonomonas sp. Marseille-P4361]
MTTTNGNYGIVYVLTNPAMPNLVKIGMTLRNEVDSRLRELYSTGVPLPFECRYACLVEINDCAKVEKAMHKAFYKNRVNPNREFFEIDPEQAIAILQLLDKRDITSEVVAELDDDSTIVEKVAAEKFKKKRRPPLNFREMSIPQGAKLQFVDDHHIEVEVCADRKVLYNDTEMSLTAATKDLLNIEHSLQPTGYWLYNGKNLSDIYNETYSNDED